MVRSQETENGIMAGHSRKINQRTSRVVGDTSNYKAETKRVASGAYGRFAEDGYLGF